MARFNNSTTVASKTTNLAGGDAFKQTDKLEFVSLLLSSFLNDQFYRSGQEQYNRLVELVDSIPDKKFLAKAALFARDEFGMRTISHVVAGELAGKVRGEPWVKNFIDKVVVRVDDMTEITSYYLQRFGRPGIAPQLKKGLASAFDKFDRYQLAKYRADGKEVSLIDVVNLVHPKPVERNADALRDLVKGTLRSEGTWESVISEAGSDEDKKSSGWRELVLSGKIAQFALLRNIRNILESSPDVIDKVCELLTLESRVRTSRIMPFDYYKAYEVIKNQVHTAEGRKAMSAIGKALDMSMCHVPKFDGRTLVVLDSSSSMWGQPLSIGAIFSAALLKTNNCDFMTFDHVATYRNYNPDDTTITITEKIMSEVNGGSTNFHAIFKTANKPYDRIIILSDMQGWVGRYTPAAEFSEYKKRFDIQPIVYSFDLAGYGTMQFPERSVFAIAGFSGKVFELFPLLERGRDVLVSRIEEVNL